MNTKRVIKVYVAGAYSDDNVLGVLRNIGRGEDYAAQLFLLGYAPFCPWHDKEFVIKHWDKDFTVEQFYNYSIAWLRVADAVFVVPDRPGLKDWEKSTGTCAEIVEAQRLGIPVFFDMYYLHKYFKESEI